MKSKLQLLKDIAEFLNTETHRQSMIDGALKMLIDHTNFKTGWIFFIKEDGKHELSAHYQLPPTLQHDNHTYLCNDKCWCVNKFNKGELSNATNIVACSRLEKAAREMPNENDNITHHATVPLLSGNESFGMLNVASPYSTEFQKDELDLLESVAFQLGSTLKRLDLTTREKENMIIKERQRLARELHDSVNQMLFSIGITSHAAKALKDSEQSSLAFERIENTSKYAMKEMKALIWQLKPIGLENGIIEAVKHYAKILDLNLEISVNGFYNIEDEMEIELYRIVQEGLNNIRKHAGTKDAAVLLEITGEELLLVISDKGRGFIPAEKIGLSHGLTNMQERVHKMNGELLIESDKGQGTALITRIKLGR